MAMSNGEEANEGRENVKGGRKEESKTTDRQRGGTERSARKGSAEQSRGAPFLIDSFHLHVARSLAWAPVLFFAPLFTVRKMAPTRSRVLAPQCLLRQAGLRASYPSSLVLSVLLSLLSSAQTKKNQQKQHRTLPSAID